MKVLVMITLGFWNNLTYQETKPIPEQACEQQAKFYNEHKVYRQDFAYCVNLEQK